MKRKQARKLRSGDPVVWKPIKGGKKRQGVVSNDGVLGRMVSVQLDGDPFPVWTEHTQVERAKGNNTKGDRAMPTANEMTTRELRKEAKAANVDDWKTLDRDELIAALGIPTGNGKSASKSKTTTKTAKKAPAKKAAAKKAPAKKAAAKTKPKVENSNPDNPWREGSNMALITEQLLKGGKRSTMVKALKKKIDLKPRTNVDEFDEDFEMDRRLLICAQILVKDHGFTKEMDGRDRETGTIKVVPPKRKGGKKG